MVYLVNKKLRFAPCEFDVVCKNHDENDDRSRKNDTILHAVLHEKRHKKKR